MNELIRKLELKENLTQPEMEAVMKLIMAGEAIDDDIAAFLLSLRAKGPTIDEITGAAKVMREFAIPIKTHHTTILDTCGTGGDKKNTFNISTIVAIVVAASGVAVAKHGNRSVSSNCGSADILEALEINLDLNDQQMSECLDKVGLSFLFAQKLHPAMKNVAPIRKELGVETIFNILGPLTNPARATHQMIGVYNRDLLEPMTIVLKNLGIKHALVFHGSDGLDEITTTGKTFISEYDGNEILNYDITPEELGIIPAQEEDLLGGDMEMNVKIVLDILNGELGPKRDIVVLNAAYALYIAGKAENVEQGIKLAEETIDDKKAMAKLEELREFTQSVA